MQIFLFVVITAFIDRKNVEADFIHVAPPPILTRFEGLNDRVAGGMIMFGGMFVLRVITAAYIATGFTKAQMEPGVT